MWEGGQILSTKKLYPLNLRDLLYLVDFLQGRQLLTLVLLSPYTQLLQTV